MTNLMDYHDAENMMYKSFLRAKPFIPQANDSITRNPEWTRVLLNLLGQPDEQIKTILVTGSKGKGSTSHFISILLRGLGYKVGLFTSPHLVHFTERIRVNGQSINQSDFLRLGRRIEPYFNQIENQLEKHEYQGPIGLTLSIALLYFQEQKVDFAVIETGRGGRFDDTNVLNNDWAVISSIFPEHVESLGPSIRDIIWHKVGIVKDVTKAVIINKQEASNQEEIKKMLLPGKNAFFYGDEFKASDIKINAKGTYFQVQTDKAEYQQICLHLLGSFQAKNTATAIKTCELIVGNELPAQMVKKTLSHTRWPGRCEIISQNPSVIVDGAINAVSANYIEEMVIKAGFQKVISIIGVPSDKDYEGVIRVASRFSNQLILSTPDESHKSFPISGLEVAKSCHEDCYEISPLKNALAFAKDQMGTDLILIIGTQTFIGNAKRLYGQFLFEL